MADIKTPRRRAARVSIPTVAKTSGEVQTELPAETAATRGRAKKRDAVPLETTPAESSIALVPATPETKKSAGAKRKRLSKAFARPLDKKLKKSVIVRERFSIPSAEYVQFGLLKNRLADQGVGVKKSELVRAGLVLLSSLGDEDLAMLMAKVPPLDQL